MLISNPPVNSHPLTNNLSNTLHSSLPSSFSASSLTPLITTNPSTWTIKQVEEWLIKHDLNDCIDLICFQHRMNGQRLMNLNEDDVLQLKGTNKNNELWLHIRKLQQFYSSNYHLWTQRSLTTSQQPSLPLTASSYFAPSPLQTPMPLRSFQQPTQIRPTSSGEIIPPPSIPLTHSETSSSSSSHTIISINQNQQNPPIFPSLSPTANQTQSSNPTTVLLERSPLTGTRSINNQQYHRRSLSHSLSISNTSINILPSTPTIQRTSNTLLNSHCTPADQIEDQPMTGCCFVGSIRSDRKKTISACLLALCTVYFCSFIITIVDERLPDPQKFPPLPDLVLDNIKQIPWAFAVTEKIIVIEMLTLVIVVVLHRHR
jgi:hypothetical protein